MKMEQGFCNGFLVLPPLTGNGSVIFGKNSDRPIGEVQELVYEPERQCTAGEPLKCTYVEVKQVEKTYAVILSKPALMWGCEMGANNQGVAIGNGLVLTKSSDNQPKTLLGTDLVRLGLERSKTAEEAVDVITNLLSEFGQSHLDCSKSSPDFSYQNWFLIADSKEGWVVETFGKHWVAQRVSSGYRNISNGLSIETQFDKSSPGVDSFAKENGYWNGEGEFNFAAAYSSEDHNSKQKYIAGHELLKKHTEDNNFKIKDMFAILRDKEISCDLQTAGSQVSMLSSKKPCCHWFTATPNPQVSVFKPFIFTPNVKISSYSKSPAEGDGRHVLYKLHAAVTSNPDNKVTSVLQEMERNCLEEVEKFLEDSEHSEGQQALSEVDELLKDIVETEVKFYK